MPEPAPAGTAHRVVLVVCTANRCRSPMAHGLLRARAATSGLGDWLEIRSAGTWTAEGDPPTAEAVIVMRERGIDISDVRSEEVTAAAVAQADLILVMTASHREALAAEFECAGKTLLMSELAGSGYDIADPVGGPVDLYRATADELERLIDAGWTIVAGEETRPEA